MDLGFKEMPTTARVIPPAPLRTTVAAAAPVRAAVVAAPVAPAASPSLALAAGARPMPRATGDGAITRDTAGIASAIAEVNAALAAQVIARNAPAPDDGRPLPRPGRAVAAAPRNPGSASTFGVAAPRAQAPAAADAQPITLASEGAGTTGGNDWGVQLGTYRAKGDAERQLLTTALRDVAQLDGGLRRVEAAKVQGVTVYRAQFVGLSQADALGACEALARAGADCLPLAPGI
jgi:D-alanyl-D-alanine carboxypeptidase